MPVEIDVIVRSDALQRGLRIAPKLFAQHLRRTFSLVLRQFMQRVSRDRLRGRPGLDRRTGALARSQEVRVDGGNDIDALVGRYSIGSQSVPYARIHEFGGTITPRNAKMLAIPLGEAQTAAGVTRAGPRAFDLFLSRSKKGNLILRRRSDGVPMFVLKDRVVIPPRLGLRALWRADKSRRDIAIAEAVERALNAAFARGGPA